MDFRFCFIFLFILKSHYESFQIEAFKLGKASATSSIDIDELKLVVLIHRHGDRTPIKPYPRDPYRNESFWPDGWGQLTLKGKKRMYDLGVYLASRYQGFLGVSPREVAIRSSGSDRCLESVSLLLSGLYPPEKRWKWNDDLGQKWQPFPIQTVPHDTDGMLNPSSKCKRAEKLKQEIMNSAEVQNFYQKMKSTLAYVRDNTGYDQVDLIQAEEVFDALMIEKTNNYELPTWVDRYVYEKLNEISTKTFIFAGMTREIQRFRAGLLLKDLLERFFNPNGKRLYIYSSHDTLVSVFLSALDAYNNLSPPFGSLVMLELHQNNNTQEFYLQAYYLNETETRRPYPLVLKDCIRQSLTDINFDNRFRRNIGQHHRLVTKKNSACLLNDFSKSINDLIPIDWEAECQNNSGNDATDVINLSIISVSLFLTMFVLVFYVFLFLNKRRHVTLYKMLPVN